MTRPSTPPILSELRSPSSPACQIAALRALKNEIIGHEQKKDMWIGLGVVAPIARILNTHRASGKRRHKEHNDNADYVGPTAPRTDEEEVRLQAVIIVGSLAHGGPAYIPPLHAGSIFPPLFSILSPTESVPVLVLAALRSLNTVADAVCLEQSQSESCSEGFLDQLFVEQNLACIAQILDQNSSDLIVQQQISLAAALVVKTCRQESRRKQLALSGVLDSLATRLASFIVSTSLTDTLKGSYFMLNSDITPATTRSRLSPILQAIGTIISDSTSRTNQFVSAIASTNVFPRGNTDSHMWRTLQTRGANRSLSGRTTEVTNSTHRFSANRDLAAQASNFPPLGALESLGQQQRTGKGFGSALETTLARGFSISEEDDPPLVSWLVRVVRAETGVTRLMASWILTLLYRSGLASNEKEASFAPLLVPLLVRMLDDDPVPKPEDSPSYDSSALQIPENILKEYAPKVLAMLIVDTPDLQHLAHCAGVLRKLSQLLKSSYDPLSSGSSSMWTPHSSVSDETSSEDAPRASKLGVRGLTHHAHHALQVRESVLTAIAAMATFKDDYRKGIIDWGVVPFVIESLKPQTSTSVLPSARTLSDKTVIVGNPVSVLLAACGTARALSRSVSTLRTSLIDAGLAAPLYVLLDHQDIEVQIAATAVICNLILEFSPMREAIIEAGILQILCEHAHSVNAKLRLNSVWALKHLVHTAPNSLKMRCLEELGPGWLKQIVCNEIDDHAIPSTNYRSHDAFQGRAGTPITMGTPNAAGEQVDLLNAVGPDSMESSQAEYEDDEDEVNMIDSIGALSKQDTSFRRHPSSQSKRPTTFERQRLILVQDEEAENIEQARRDDVLVQEQGLDFIRNLICGESEMIDYLFRELGQDTIFDIFASRLRPKVVDAFSRDRKSAGVKHEPPQTEIIISVVYILVHIAGGLPRHRQLLISQSELLKQIVPLFSHHYFEVRIACVFLVIHLTWMDDQSDKLHCKSRAHELRKLGVYEKLVQLEQDPELDVRERSKMARHQMSELLR